ncbi:MAG: phage shock protein operon transcriptional activator [Planctomycetota bacterium]
MRVEEAIGRSKAFLAFTERLSRAAAVDRPVLLIGERGTGKELAAAKLHYLSRRWEGPLLALNCAALTPALEMLEAHAWPGNIRELKNVVERAVHRAEAGQVGVEAIDFDPFGRYGEPCTAAMATKPAPAVDPPAVPGRSTLPSSLPEAVARLEIEALRGALQATRHHQRKAAALLGLTYHQFRGLYRKHAAQLEE